MIRYFLYARKSEEDEGRQVLSIEAQLTELREFALRDSLLIVEEFVESRTAKVPGRPVFGKMMEKIQNSRAPIGLLAWHPDRLARNSVDGGLVIYLVDTGNILNLRFPTFWFEATPQGKFMLNIAFGQSKYYVDNLQENIKRGQRQKLRRGEYPGMAPLGYINERNLHTIVQDPEKAPLILRMFKEFGENNLTVRQVHEQSIKWGFRSHSGKPISISALYLILQNQFYVGLFKWNGERFEGSHPAIVPRELFDKVQAKLRHARKPRHKWKTPFMFIGFLRCHCGCSVTAERQKGHIYSERFDFSSKTLSESLKKTFGKRSTPITLEPVVFSGAFETNERKIIQWNVFLRRSEITHGPKDLKAAIESIKKFLIPVIKECIGDSDKSLHWKAPGPWRPEK